ncbi:MAG: hypothetical protein HY010_03370 [Acidobacteria bacterium]|nr:hypothetical protein [Acidobacteriota bacterium]
MKLHDEYRKKIWEDSVSGSENFDKYLITFSTGALALSLSFIKDVVPLRDAIWISLLIVSWAAFILAALVTLVSFRFSLSALERMVPVLNDYYLNAKPAAYDKHMDDLRTKAVDWCAWAGLFFFVLGLICTMIFVSGNVLRANAMEDKENLQKGNSVRIDRIDFGCKPPAMTPMTPNAKFEAHAGQDKVEKGVKPPRFTPVPPSPTPTPQPCPAEPPKK